MRWYITLVSLLFLILNAVICQQKKQTEEVEAEIWSNKADTKNRSFYSHPEWDKYYTVLYSADCSLSLAPEISYHVNVVGVGLNMTSGTFEKCEPTSSRGYQSRQRMVLSRASTKIFLMERDSRIRELGQYNKTWSCPDVMSWWKDVVGADLPSWCALFSVISMWKDDNATNRYLDAQMRLGHEKDLLIFKYLPEVEKDTSEASDIVWKLIESTIIHKKIPKLFLERFWFQTTTSPPLTKAKEITTKATQKARTQKRRQTVTQENHRTGTPPIPSLRRSDGAEEQTSDRYGIETEAQPALDTAPSPDAMSLDSNAKAHKGLIIGLLVLVAAFSVVTIGVVVTLILILVRRRRNNKYADNTSTNQTKGEPTTEGTSTIPCGLSYPTLTEDTGIEDY